MHPDKKAKLAVRNIIKNALCSRCSLAQSYDIDRLKRNCPNKECRSLIHGMIRKILGEVIYPLIKKGGRYASEEPQAAGEEKGS